MKKNVMSTDSVFNPRFLAFYQPLHEKFTPWQQKIAENRKKRNARARARHLRVGYKDAWDIARWSDWGNLELPTFPDFPQDFKIQLPAWCQDQRNQMTGPADDTALVVKMMNSGAPGVMVDLEDSTANTWKNIHQGYINLYNLFKGELSYMKNDEKIKVKTAEEAEVPTTLWIRARGLHMAQVLKFPLSLQTIETSASLLDVCMAAFNFANDKLPCLKQPLAFYIPKSEHAEEALWWAELFKDIAKTRGWPANYIKCMALVESHSLAYQMEEFIWNLKDHILGLNLGRWDYMASLIEQNIWDRDWVLPDRNGIPHDVAFFQELRKHMVNVCHSHGILAIGGMTALYPSRKDKELNDRALKVLEADKKNEAQMGMDGAWTGHPDQNLIAVSQFPHPNQVGKLHADPETFEWNRHPDLRPALEGGEITEEGTRQALRAAIRYRNGVLNGRGASLLDGYMEDLATDRICRLMITQRLRHNHVPDDGVEIYRLADEELARLIEDGGEVGTEETLREAKELTLAYITNETHNPE
jgi:malate synthase